MKFLRNLWDKIGQALSEFLADLIGEYDAEKAEAVPQQADEFKAHSAGYFDPGANDRW